jgi:hypothetical protein
VHRLDKDTTGLMVVAKNDRAHAGLAAQFADHGRSGPLERAYRALVWGAPEPREGTVRTGIARSTQHRERMAAVAEGQGRIAVTRYTVEERWPDAAEPLAGLVRCELETGRTHQIRVHMAHAGHPLLGDALYGSGFKTKANRLDDDARTALEQLSRQAFARRRARLRAPDDRRDAPFRECDAGRHGAAGDSSQDGGRRGCDTRPRGAGSCASAHQTPPRALEPTEHQASALAAGAEASYKRRFTGSPRTWGPERARQS